MSPSFERRLAAVAQEAKLRAFKEGLQDGVLMTLCLALKRPDKVVDPEVFKVGRYTGPIDPELREWLETALARVLAERHESGRS